MNELSEIFSELSSVLHEADIHALLIGGFAVNYYGYTRNTLDIDFMIAAEDMGALRDAMLRKGFTNVSPHDNVVFFSRPLSAVRIDFLKVDHSTMAELLEHSRVVEYHGRPIRVPSLENLLAMKFFALHHGGARRMDKDMPDIVRLSVLNSVDPEKVLKPLCIRYASEELYIEIEKRIKALKEC